MRNVIRFCGIALAIAVAIPLSTPNQAEANATPFNPGLAVKDRTLRSHYETDCCRIDGKCHSEDSCTACNYTPGPNAGSNCWVFAGKCQAEGGEVNSTCGESFCQCKY